MYNHLILMLQSLKENRPLILNITNYVTMDFIANGLLSLGASPIMANAQNELEDLIRIAQGVVINIGTLNDEFIALCHKACSIANTMGKPIILDPVGAGASEYRTETCVNLLAKYKFSVIRGNASEIMALCGAHHNTKGVDTNMLSTDVIASAKIFSLQQDAVIAVSGKTDVIVFGDQVTLLERGSALMPSITGSGCLLTAVISAFNVISSEKYLSTCAAVMFYGVCGELATREARGPGSFKVHFLDALARLPKQEDY